MILSKPTDDSPTNRIVPAEYPSRRFEHKSQPVWATCYPWPGDEEWLICYVGQYVKVDDLRLRRIEYPMSELALDEAMRAFERTQVPLRE